MNHTSLKTRMTFDEMAKAFASEFTWLSPNYANVGRYAKRNGYTKHKQMINGKLIYFYLKQD